MPHHFFSSSSFFRSSFILFLLFCPRDRSFNVTFLFLEYTCIYIYEKRFDVFKDIYRAHAISRPCFQIIFYRILYFFYIFSFSLILVSFRSCFQRSDTVTNFSSENFFRWKFFLIWNSIFFFFFKLIIGTLFWILFLTIAIVFTKLYLISIAL